MTLLVAQALGEYGGMGAVLADGVFRLRIFVEEQLLDRGPRSWVLLLGGLGLLWLVFRGRR